MRHRLASCALALLCASTAYSQTISVPPDSPRWDLQGKAEVADYLGRKCLLLDGGAAILKDFEMRDAVIDVDVATPAVRGFFGFQFRLADEGANGEWVYLRQHKSGYPDAMQYTPILNTGANWQIYNGEGFTGNVDIPKGEWFHLRLVVTGAQAKLYVKDMEKPALVMDDLKSGVQKGEFALHDLIGATYFSNFEIRTTPDAPWAAPHTGDAGGDADEVADLALVRRAREERRAAADRGRERRHPVAERRSGAAGLRRAVPLPPGAAPESDVRDRLHEAPGAPAGHAARLRADHDRRRMATGSGSSRSATATRSACS